MRLGLPRVLPFLLLPSLSLLAAQFRNIYHGSTRGVSVSQATVQTWFPAGVMVCSLSVTTDLLTIQHSEVECKGFRETDNSTEISSHTWTFYDKMENSLYRLEVSLTLLPRTDTILQLSLCVSPDLCGGETDLPTSHCFSYPPSVPSSSASHYSSAPEGFIFAIAGHSSSSELQETTTTTIEPPEVQPIQAEVSSASLPSFVSSDPEGFIMAFTAEGSSSISTRSSQAEGFVFAFNNNNNQESSAGSSQGEETVNPFISSIQL